MNIQNFTKEETIEQQVCGWDYAGSWLPFKPDTGVTPLSEVEIKKKLESQPNDNHKSAFKLVGDLVFCSSKHGGLVLLKNGYVPTFFKG